MNGPPIAIPPAAVGGAWLLSVTAEDNRTLREWRNAAADAFFERAPITQEDQQRWFESYLTRREDFLFMVMEADAARGCLGVRMRDGEWDIYNVIRGTRTIGSRGFLACGLKMLVAFARSRAELPVRAIVLAENPAVLWYERNGFRIVGWRNGGILMYWTATKNTDT